MSAGLFDNAIAILNDPEQFDSGNALLQIVNRLNQWLSVQQPLEDWRRDPLLDSLPEELTELAAVKSLPAVRLSLEDGMLLQEVIWLRNVARHSVSDQISAVGRAAALFDWTVRNIQLHDPAPAGDSPSAVVHSPGEVLLLGRGTDQERGWLFILLARQLGLDVVMLAVPDVSQDGQLKPWLPALWDEGRLVLFDARLGLAIPGPQGQGIATLEQVVNDTALLRNLDLDEAHRYPIETSDLQHVVALVEASPFYLAQRTSLIETQLAGERQMVLSTNAAWLADAVAKHPHISQARLWELPYRRLEQRQNLKPQAADALRDELTPFRQPNEYLWRGRLLQLAGRYVGQVGANRYFQLARPPDAKVETAQLDAPTRRNIRIAKQNASYWLGLVAYQRQQYATAVRDFKQLCLEAFPEGPWTAGAWYNLGRTYEALQQTDKAVECYRSDRSPQRHGSLLRAGWLEQGTFNAL